MESDIDTIDCAVALGCSAGGQWRSNKDITAADVVGQLDRVGSRLAVVHHLLAQEYAPAIGNARVVEEVTNEPRLLPCWLVLPHHTGEFPAPEVLIERMRAQSVVMARLHPSADASAHRFSLADWVIGDLLDAMTVERIPVAVDFSLFRRADPPWESLHRTLLRHPDLDVILIEIQGRNNRTLYPLLDAHPRLRVQTAGLNVHLGIEDVVQRFGAERLVFGSGYPRRSMGAAAFHLATANISDADRALIASGNMSRMLRLTERSVARSEAG
ncbi:MAG: amidohydrolase family protein [Tetrasphaera sp.]|nr:amidohydrolase family protein [Tetrasphaera sp.]